jgi:hypothetical protein
MALPKVTKDTLASVKHYLDGREVSGDKAFGEVVDAMNKENPTLLSVVINYCETYGESGKDKRKISNCAFMLYKLLQSQEESNILKDSFLFEEIDES